MRGIWIGCFATTNLKSAVRNLKSAILIGSMLVALCAVAEAQQPGKVYRIGYLGTSGRGPFSEAFALGLRDHRIRNCKESSNRVPIR